MVAEKRQQRLKVLVTRPERQAKNLCEMIVQAGAQPIAFPVIDIRPIEIQDKTNVTLTGLDMLIFVSSNAVKYFMTDSQKDLLNSVQIVSMGSATTACLQKYGIYVDIQPPAPVSSESLLAMPIMENVNNKRILIVRGEGGRELLADTLAARGANISYIEVYKRCLPSFETVDIEQAKQADCIVVTSIVGLDNLCQLIGDDSLKHKWLIVVSERIKQYAMQLGFQQVIVTSDASDNAVMQQVNKLEIFDG